MHKSLLGLLIPILLTFSTEFAMAIEDPPYEVLLQDSSYELRHYHPMLIAQVKVEGDMDEASNKGFRLIADYIFGNNITPASPGSIARENEKTSVKIAMTAPVTVEPQLKSIPIASSSLWRVNFVMPAQYTLATIPKPKNSAIELIEVPEKYYAVLTYSGFNFESKVQSQMEDTLKWVQQKGYQALSNPQLSRYNPPWTLPMFRRNEIMVEIAYPEKLK